METKEVVEKKAAREVISNAETEIKKEGKNALQENLKGKSIFMTKATRKTEGAENDIEENVEEGHEIGNKFKAQLAVIDEIYGENKSWKKFFHISSEIMQNIARYSTKDKPIIFEIKENEEEGKPVGKIETLNYFKDEDWTKTAALKKKMDEVNSLSKEEKKEKYKEALTATHKTQDEIAKWDDGIHKNWGAGLWFLDIGDKLKNDIDKPFIYSFQKDKDGLVRFKLLINIPMKESLLPIKKAHDGKEKMKKIQYEGMLQMKIEEEIKMNKKWENENSFLKQQLERSKQRMKRLQNTLNQ